MKFSAIPLNHVTLMYISDNMSYSVPYMGKVSQGKILAYHTGKAIGKETFDEEAEVSVYVQLGVSVNIGEDNFGELPRIHQICQFFPCHNFSV